MHEHVHYFCSWSFGVSQKVHIFQSTYTGNDNFHVCYPDWIWMWSISACFIFAISPFRDIPCIQYIA